jgi:hypothetical protein
MNEIEKEVIWDKFVGKVTIRQRKGKVCQNRDIGYFSEWNWLAGIRLKCCLGCMLMFLFGCLGGFITRDSALFAKP